MEAARHTALPDISLQRTGLKESAREAVDSRNALE
jgi:hypothetical protein